ncbi:M23 family metallopeptidase [Microbacterium sp. H1-D42]|uniref:murein hydrolase activator EnvC family protein n=1 Tax=Microbacterium sp. H1-D42 TaxID=2925844 RepID=UPI001F52E065|nr:M23 family metallopeptidase [Microbacterium sp. H1-D42]UNK69367.1 M23 family metallopeptidase [Microbacterium sp. H1-D42]
MLSRSARMPDAVHLARRRISAASRSVLIGVLTGVLLGALPAAASPAPGRGSAPTAVADAPGADWLWPVPGPRTVTAPFRAPAHEYGPGHRGMDVAAGPGTAVSAPADGVVAFRSTVVDRPLLTIDHGHGYVSTWEPLDSTLTPGDVIAAGDMIGIVASGGHAVRGTLHVGVRVDDVYVNPRPLFGDVPRAVLLPCCE